MAKFLVFLCVSAVLFLLQNADLTEGLDVQFNGGDYMRWDSDTAARSSNYLRLSFQTMHPSGLLFYAGDYTTNIAVFLQNGRLVVSVSLCPGNKCSYTVITGPDNLCDNVLHTVHLLRLDNKVQITIGSLKHQAFIQGPAFRLFSNKKTFVAGMPSNRKKGCALVAIHQIGNFHGCLRGISFDDFTLEHSLGKRNLHIMGSPSKGCMQHIYRPFGFLNPYSVVSLVTFPYKKKLIASLFFRTFIGWGTLISARTNFMKFLLVLESGKVVIRVTFLKQKTQLQKSTGQDLGDGDWHKVAVELSSEGVSLVVDHWRPVTAEFQNPGTGHFKAVNVGSSGDYYTGFVGCMNKLRINGLKISPKHVNINFKVRGAKLGTCPLKNQCFPNPCKNNGLCNPSHKGYNCDCTSTFYTGNQCEEPVVIKSTCQEYVDIGLVNDSRCLIDADGGGTQEPFEVVCSTSAVGTPMTSISNNRNGSQRVSATDTVAGDDMYFHHIKYSTDMKMIKSLTEKSLECRQYIQFSCFNTKVINAPKYSTPQVRWISRNGEYQDFWGEAITEVATARKCGKHTDCTGPSGLCSLDDGGDKWYNDSGYIKDKSLLPVTVLQFTSDASNSFYSIGPLECFGTTSKRAAKNISPLAKESLRRLCKQLYHHPGQQESTSGERHKESGYNVDDRKAYEIEPERVQGHFTRATTDATSLQFMNYYENGKVINATAAAKARVTTGSYSAMFLLPAAIGLIIVLAVLLIACVIYCIKRKGLKMPSLRRGSYVKQWMDSTSDDGIALAPEPDLWMTMNAGGYNVKTGKITYGTGAQLLPQSKVILGE